MCVSARPFNYLLVGYIKFCFFYFITDAQLHLQTAFMVYLYLLGCYGDCKLHFVNRFNTKFLQHWHLQPNDLFLFLF